jgi:dethiobiotin synthetase
MKRYFVTSSGTGIGKTYITAMLTRKWRQQGNNVQALKPIISGWDPADASMDSFQLLDAMEQPHDDAHIEQISPWRFKQPLSPDMAAAMEGRELSLTEIVDFCQQDRPQNHSQNRPCDICLIEGVGGVMVPLNAEHMVLDWIEALSCEAILVVGSYLGAISHTLTAYHALRSRSIPIYKVIVSETPESTVSLEQTCTTLRNFIDAPIEVVEFGAKDNTSQ